jgi:hypothetical protein
MSYSNWKGKASNKNMEKETKKVIIAPFAQENNDENSQGQEENTETTEETGYPRQISMPPPMPPGFHSSTSPFSLRQTIFYLLIAVTMSLVGYSLVQVLLICLAFLLLETGRYAAMQTVRPRLKDEKALKKSTALLVEMAGPLPGILLGFLLFFRGKHGGDEMILFTSYVLLIVNTVSLLPMKGLSGERLAAILFPAGQYHVRLVFLVLVIIALAGLAWWLQSIWMGLLPLFFIFRLRRLYSIIKMKKEMRRQEIPENKMISQLKTDQLIAARKLVEKDMGLARLGKDKEAPMLLIEKHIWNTVAKLFSYPYRDDMGHSGILLAVLTWAALLAAPFILVQIFSK